MTEAALLSSLATILDEFGGGALGLAVVLAPLEAEAPQPAAGLRLAAADGEDAVDLSDRLLDHRVPLGRELRGDAHRAVPEVQRLLDQRLVVERLDPLFELLDVNRAEHVPAAKEWCSALTLAER